MSFKGSLPLRLFRKQTVKVGQPPGTLTALVEDRAEPPRITLFDYDQNTCDERQIDTSAELQSLKETDSVTWINVDGIDDVKVIEEIGEIFDIHPLVLEDILNPAQPIKTEDYDDYVFIVLKMITYSEESNSFSKENVSLILGKNVLISFQEKPGDVFDSIRERIQKSKGRLREAGCDYLAYRLIDAVVDHYFVVLEKYGESIESLEVELSNGSDADLPNEIQRLKRELLLLLRAVWPCREMMSRMMKEDLFLITNETKIFLRDVQDHIIQVTDTITSFRELASDMLEAYNSNISNKMNDIMKFLTIFATIFIPLTFIVGVYGMNFEFLPELKWHWAYPVVWVVMIAVVAAMLAYFKRKKWF